MQGAPFHLATWSSLSEIDRTAPARMAGAGSIAARSTGPQCHHRDEVKDQGPTAHHNRGRRISQPLCSAVARSFEFVETTGVLPSHDRPVQGLVPDGQTGRLYGNRSLQ